jgi:hypothetical protein
MTRIIVSILAGLVLAGSRNADLPAIQVQPVQGDQVGLRPAGPLEYTPFAA